MIKIMKMNEQKAGAMYVEKDEFAQNEIHNIVRPELEAKDPGDDDGKVLNLFEATVTVIGGGALLWGFLWIYFFVTQTP